MNPKTTVYLVVALVVAVAGVWLVNLSDSSGPATSGPKALFDPAPTSLAAFEVGFSDREPLRFEMTDGVWKMTAPRPDAADQVAVNADANKIKTLEYVRSYSPSDSDRPKAELTSLDPPLRTVKLTDTDGKTYELKIGARQQLSEHTYVQKAGDDTIYLVKADLHAELKKSQAEYRGKLVSQFPQVSAVRVEVSGEQNYTLVKSGEQWTVASPIQARADRGKVSSLLSSLSNLSATDFVEDVPTNLRPYGLETPRLRIAVTVEKKTPKPPPASAPASAPAEPQFDITTSVVRLAFGAMAEDKVFARIDDTSTSPVFRVAEGPYKILSQGLDELRDKKMADVAGRVQKISISAGADSVELNLADGAWRIVSGPQANSNAEYAAVDDYIKTVRNLSAVGFEPRDAAAHGLDAPRAVVQLSVEGKTEPVKLAVGNRTPSGTGVYVKNEGEGFIGVVNKDAAETLIASPVSFLDRALMIVPQSQVTQLDLTFEKWSCTLQRDGAAWKFVKPVEGPTEPSSVNNVLSDLTNLRGRRVVAAAGDAAHYGLDRPRVRAAVTVQPPAPPAPPPTTQTSQPAAPPLPPPVVHTLLVGKKDNKVYAMVEGGASICEVDSKVLDDLEAELFDTKVAKIDAAQVSGVRFRAPSSFAFTKVGDDWRLQGEPTFAVDSLKLTTLLTAVNDLRAVHYEQYAGAAPADYGLDQPAIAVEIETLGETTTLLISARGPAGEDRYAMIASTNGRVFVMKGEDVAKFSKQLTDFRKQG